jgi:hypothetical protein
VVCLSARRTEQISFDFLLVHLPSFLTHVAVDKLVYKRTVFALHILVVASNEVRSKPDKLKQLGGQETLLFNLLDLS